MMEMDDSGEAGYLCTLSEHLIPNLTGVAILEDREVRQIEAASPLLQNVKVAVVETKFRPLDYHLGDVFQVVPPQGLIEAVGHIQGIQPQEWPIDAVFEQIAASEPVRAA
jgi:hypothetical protein